MVAMVGIHAKDRVEARDTIKIGIFRENTKEALPETGRDGATA